MRRLLLLISLFALIFIVSPSPTHAADFRADSSSVTFSSPVQGDAFAVSNTVTFKSSVSGEAYLAGNTVSVTQPISRSAYVIGSTVTVSKGTGYNLFIVGGNITVGGTIGNDVYIAGSTITFNNDTVINGDVWLEGGTVNLHGIIKGSVHTDIDTLNSNAAIGGSLSGNISSANFTGGSIGGTFHYSSGSDATGLSKVTILGGTSRTTPSNSSANFWDIIKATLTAMVAMLLLGTLLALRAPNLVTSLLDKVGHSPFIMFLYGLAWILFAPLACFALAVTFIGWKVALLLFLVYAIFLLLAGAVGMFLVGSWTYKRFVPHHRNNIWDYLITGILIVYILGAIPYIGIAVSLLFGIFAFLPCLGALSSHLFERE